MITVSYQVKVEDFVQVGRPVGAWRNDAKYFDILTAHFTGHLSIVRRSSVPPCSPVKDWGGNQALRIVPSELKQRWKPFGSTLPEVQQEPLTSPSKKTSSTKRKVSCLRLSRVEMYEWYKSCFQDTKARVASPSNRKRQKSGCE